jgi:DUF4097 and DUF4098 domain-containing protein YvlB
MRPRSFIGPLILIALGGIFLANNLRPDLPILELLGRYWPFLLIGWGVLRLIEVLYWSATRKPLPDRGISGGEWGLVVVIVVIGTSVLIGTRFRDRWGSNRYTVRGLEVFGESYDYPMSGNSPCGKAPKVVIDNARGNVRITTADTEDCKLSGTKTVKSFQQAEADRYNKDTPLEMVRQGDQLIVRTNHDRIGGWPRVKADLEIVVPKGASIEGRNRYGDYDISDLAGSVEINSENAGVRVQNIGGTVRIDARRSDVIRAVGVKGAIDVKGGRGQDLELENIEGMVTINGSFSGDLQFRNIAKPIRFESAQTTMRVEKAPGQIRMALGNLTANNLVGPIQITTKNKDVQLSDFTQSAEISVDRGDIELKPVKLPLAKMDVHTKGGNIEMSFPAGAKFDLRASARRGEAENETGLPLRSDTEGNGKGRSNLLTGSIGQGPQITLTTDHGNVTLKKAGVAVETAAPAMKPDATKKAPQAIKTEQQ